MEFFQTLPCASENDTVSVKLEVDEDNIIAVRDNYDELENEEGMEFTESKPVIAEIINNSASAEIKQETTDDFPSAGAQDFVFVACADNVAFNEMKLENRNANANVCDSSARENTQKPCPYCGKNYTSLNVHAQTCELRFVYPCAFCPSVLYRRNNVKRHIQLKHSRELKGKSVDDIYREIVTKRVELNVETAAEKIKVVSEMMTNVSLRAEINSRPVVTDRTPKFIVPNVEIRQKSADMPCPPLFVIVAENSISQNNNVSNAIEKPSSSKESAVDGSGEDQQSSVHHVFTYKKVNPIDKQCESVSTKIAATTEFVHCNECGYQTHDKIDLISHIRMEHSFQLNLVSYDCSKCKKTFIGRDSMVAHRANCNFKTLYSCLFCPKGLLIKAKIFAHIHDQHADEVAKKKLTEIAALVEANKRVVDFSDVNQVEQLADMQRQPNVSPVMVVETRNIEKESREPNYVSCDKCTYKTTDSELLHKHLMNCHGDKLNLQMWQCRNCEQSFTNRYDSIAHEATCTIRIYFSCPVCKKIFMRKNNIKKHLCQAHFREAEDQSAIDRLVEAAKRVVDTSIIETQKESTKITNTEKKSSKVADTEKESTKIVDTKQNSTNVGTQNEDIKIIEIEKESTTIIEAQKESPKIIEAQKESTKVIETQQERTKTIETKTSTTKPKIQYLCCDHCRFKTRRKNLLVGHIKKQHSAELNLAKNWKGHFNYRCTFCPQVYVCMDKVKLHVSRKHSSELSNSTMDEVAQEIFSKRTKASGPLKSNADPFVDPDEIDASTLDHVLVYCDKCKTLKTAPGTLKARKNNCRDCGARIIYLCSKCKNSHALFYMEFRKHWSQCTEMNEISQDYLDKLVIYKCLQCQFSTTHKFKLNMHFARSKHKAADGKSVEKEKNEKTTDDLEVYDEAKFAVRTSVVDFATMTHRYCPKCDKVVTEEMQPRKPKAKGLICQVCQTHLHAQCVKCNIRRSNWTTMRYHLNTKCFTGEYLCTKCPQRTTNWQAMQKHYTFRHTNRREPYLCEYCSFRNIHQSNFKMHLKKMHPDKKDHPVFTKGDLAPRSDVDYACDLCSFKSKKKGCLKVHLHTVHSTKKHKCKLCKFKTKYAESLKRHVVTRHQNFY